MEKYRLNNGITLIYNKSPGNSVTVQVLVKTGSNNEQKNISGVSHFIEHMLFEGTKKRPDSRAIANEVEKLGGIFNAYTSGEITCYYVKLMSRDMDRALDILSDILINPVFNEKSIEKEKKVILKELHMVIDDPRFYQWRLFQKELFKAHPAGNPTLGTEISLKGMSRAKILDYYSGNYSPDNAVISIAGNVDNVKSKVNGYFSGWKGKKLPESGHLAPPKQAFSLKKEKRKILSSYWVIGYKTPPRSAGESYALDVISAVLGRGQSGKIFDEIRNRRGMAYEVGINYEPAKDYGYFAVYASTDKTNVEKGKNIVLDEFKKLQKLSEEDLNEAKTYIEGRHAIEMDETDKLADKLAYWEFVSEAEDALHYIDNIMSVTLDDVKNAAGKFLNGDYTMVVLEPK